MVLGKADKIQSFFVTAKMSRFLTSQSCIFGSKKWICCRVLLLVWFSGSGSIGSCCVRAAHAQSQGWGTGGGGFGPRTAGWKPRFTRSKAQLPIYELGGEVGAKIHFFLCRLIFKFVLMSSKQCYHSCILDWNFLYVYFNIENLQFHGTVFSKNVPWFQPKLKTFS